MKDMQIVTVELERGDDTCACCGAFIRNIVRIDGVPYGTKCALAFLPRNPEIKNAKKNFAQALEAQKVARRLALYRTMIDFAYANLPEALKNRPTEFYVDYQERRINSEYRANVTMILAARNLYV